MTSEWIDKEVTCKRLVVSSQRDGEFEVSKLGPTTVEHYDKPETVAIYYHKDGSVHVIILQR